MKCSASKGTKKRRTCRTCKLYEQRHKEDFAEKCVLQGRIGAADVRIADLQRQAAARENGLAALRRTAELKEAAARDLLRVVAESRLLQMHAASLLDAAGKAAVVKAALFYAADQLAEAMNRCHEVDLKV